MPLQSYNDKSIDLHSAVFQRRDEAQFAVSKAVGAINMLPGVVGNWTMAKLNKESIPDSSGNGMTLARYGSVAGMVGIAQYASLNGTSDYFMRPDEEDFGGSNFVLGGWFNFGSLGTNMSMISKWNSATANRSFLFIKTSSNTIQLLLSEDGTTSITCETTTTVLANQWYFLAANKGADTAGVCINKTWTRFSSGIPATIYQGTADFIIGKTESDSGNMFFGGAAALCWFSSWVDAPESSIISVYEQTRAMFGI